MQQFLNEKSDIKMWKWSLSLHTEIVKKRAQPIKFSDYKFALDAYNSFFNQVNKHVSPTCMVVSVEVWNLFHGSLWNEYHLMQFYSIWFFMRRPHEILSPSVTDPTWLLTYRFLVKLLMNTNRVAAAALTEPANGIVSGNLVCSRLHIKTKKQ